MKWNIFASMRKNGYNLSKETGALKWLSTNHNFTIKRKDKEELLSFEAQTNTSKTYNNKTIMLTISL